MKLFYLTLLFLTAMSSTTKADPVKSSETILHYLVRQPKIKSEHPPIIILLHGIGSNENDLFSFADQLPDNFLVISARAPYEIGKGSYALYQVDFSSGKPVINEEQAEKSRNTIIQFIDQLKGLYHFDETQIYLCGFSQGAIMSYSVGLTNPGKIKGIAVMSGRILDEVKPKIVATEKLRHLKVFISHGTNDNVLPIHYARESNDYLKHLGINAKYKEYSDVHTINKDMLADLVKWFDQK